MEKKFSYNENHLLLAKFAKAMSHPARIFILQKLIKENSFCCNGGIANDLPIGKSTISQHFNQLEKVGFIHSEKEHQSVKYFMNYENWILVKNLFNQLFNK
jgi:DNA-binding transcriptional ArsR family regulator